MNSQKPQAPGAGASSKASSKFVWPPAIYGAASAIAVVLAWWMPRTFIPDALILPLRVIGVAIIVVGVVIVLAAARLFRRAGTPVPPTEPTTVLVTGGIYRWTRNPMYLGLSLILLGIGFATGSVWFFIALVAAVFAVTKLAIEKEEVYLADKFGAPYLDYKSRVRRWI